MERQGDFAHAVEEECQKKEYDGQAGANSRARARTLSGVTIQRSGALYSNCTASLPVARSMRNSAAIHGFLPSALAIASRNCSSASKMPKSVGDTGTARPSSV